MNQINNIILHLDWKFISILEFAIIFFLFIIIFIIKRKKSEKEIILNEYKNENIDMDNIMSSIYKSNELFKLLSKFCHPDKHIDKTYYNEIAELYQHISKDRRNYGKLLEYKKIAETKFNIDFK